jgi:hypothetical protein
MEKLTIQHIAPYLPYGLMGTVTDEMRLEYISEVDMVGDELITFKNAPDVYFEEIENFKPHLLPISCLTKTIQHGNESFVPMERLRKLSCWHKEDMKWFEIAMSAFSNSTEELEFRDLPYGVCEKLAEWHINFVGIPEGLYIDKNTLK